MGACDGEEGTASNTHSVTGNKETVWCSAVLFCAVTGCSVVTERP